MHTLMVVIFDGFEPTGRIHIGHSVPRVCSMESGDDLVIMIADYHAMLNKKCSEKDGALAMKKMQLAGGYAINVYRILGLNFNNVRWRWASQLILKNYDDYFAMVMKVSSLISINDFMKCVGDIAHIDECDVKEKINIGQSLYVAMQCADILSAKPDIISMSSDQVNINTLCCKVIEKITGEKPPELRIMPLILGIDGKEKMSKSDPTNAIFLDDSPTELDEKISRIQCRRGCENDVCLQYFEMLIYPFFALKKRSVSEEHKTFGFFKVDYLSGKIGDNEVKGLLLRCINEIAEPIRKEYQTNDYFRDMCDELRKW